MIGRREKWSGLEIRQLRRRWDARNGRDVEILGPGVLGDDVAGLPVSN